MDLTEKIKEGIQKAMSNLDVHPKFKDLASRLESSAEELLESFRQLEESKWEVVESNKKLNEALQESRRQVAESRRQVAESIAGAFEHLNTLKIQLQGVTVNSPSNIQFVLDHLRAQITQIVNDYFHKSPHETLIDHLTGLKDIEDPELAKSLIEEAIKSSMPSLPEQFPVNNKK